MKCRVFRLEKRPECSAFENVIKTCFIDLSRVWQLRFRTNEDLVLLSLVEEKLTAVVIFGHY